MATLTPGTLLKLLQSMNSNTKPTSEYRSSLLQVTAILPTLPSNNPSNSLWPNHGFLLQLSDSKNSTYISLSSRDTDLILSNRIQLGQFLYLDRFVFDPSSSPLPFSSNIRPLPGRHPFIGTPQGLIVGVSGNCRDYVIQPVDEDNSNDSFDSIISLLHQQQGQKKSNKNENNKENNSDNVNNGDNVNVSVGVTPRRFASLVMVKRSVSAGRREKDKEKERERDPSPAVVKGKRSASPVPSKCVVPSLAAAKESQEGRKAAAIVVPSRYRNPSPRRSASPVTRRMSLSPARRLSGGGGGRKKSIGGGGGGVNMKVGEGQNGKSGSGGRKSWDEVEVKERSGSVKSKPDLQAIIRTQVFLILIFVLNMFVNYCFVKDYVVQTCL